MSSGSLRKTDLEKWIKAGVPIAGRSEGGGLTFTLSPALTATWIFRHRHGGRQREITVGNYSDVSSMMQEIFICFLEEIYFMVNSGIMKKDLAMYTFGHYAQMAADNRDFWNDLTKDHPFYAHFRAFCDLAKSYQPSSATTKAKVVY